MGRGYWGRWACISHLMASKFCKLAQTRCRFGLAPQKAWPATARSRVSVKWKLKLTEQALRRSLSASAMVLPTTTLGAMVRSPHVAAAMRWRSIAHVARD